MRWLPPKECIMEEYFAHWEEELPAFRSLANQFVSKKMYYRVSMPPIFHQFSFCVSLRTGINVQTVHIHPGEGPSHSPITKITIFHSFQLETQVLYCLTHTHTHTHEGRKSKSLSQWRWLKTKLKIFYFNPVLFCIVDKRVANYKAEAFLEVGHSASWVQATHYFYLFIYICQKWYWVLLFLQLIHRT